MLGRRAKKPGGGLPEPSRASSSGKPSRPFADGDAVAAPEHVHAGGPVLFSRGESSGGGDRRSKQAAKSCCRRPWDEGRPVGLGLANTLNREATTGAATTVSGIEASEYTRVISRGRNPWTTHHVGVDSGGWLSAGGGDGGEFLRWCHGCGKDLGQGKDIFMYRGEMAFCSHECRYSKMLLDEKL